MSYFVNTNLDDDRLIEGKSGHVEDVTLIEVVVAGVHIAILSPLSAILSTP